MPFHAVVEEFDASSVVGLLFELERATVLHELSELDRVAATKFLEWRFDLLFLDVIIFLVLAPTG